MKIAFATTGDTRDVPDPTAAPQRGMGAPRRSPRSQPAPRSFTNQSAQWASYAASVVGFPSRVFSVRSVADAAAVVRSLSDRSLETVYFIGHGGGCYFFRVEQVMNGSLNTDGVRGVTSAGLSSPYVGRALLESLPTAGFMDALAPKFIRGRGREARLEFRCCFLDRGTSDHVARALQSYGPDLAVRLVGYTSFFMLALQSGNRWRAALSRRDDSEILGTSVVGTRAPPFEIDISLPPRDIGLSTDSSP